MRRAIAARSACGAYVPTNYHRYIGFEVAKPLLERAFLVTYGDSFLPIDFAAVYRAFGACGRPALMTVFRNDGRWDASNVIFEGGQVVLYDKQRRTRPAADFAFIDYGLSAMSRQVIADRVASGARADLFSSRL